MYIRASIVDFKC